MVYVELESKDSLVYNSKASTLLHTTARMGLWWYCYSNDPKIKYCTTNTENNDKICIFIMGGLGF